MELQNDHARLMDRIYRNQTVFYDATRKYYLHGRDFLLREMLKDSGPRVLEIGCGTARNLIHLGRKRSDFELYGLDASKAMLDTGHRKLTRAGLSRIRLTHALAEDTSPALFDLREPFDTVFFSFSLSMIPDWNAALRAALASLKPGGTLYVVDFWDLSGLPGPLRAGLRWWLHRFHVHYRPEAVRFLEREAQCGRGRFEMKTFAGGYSVRIRFTKAP